MYPTLQPLQHVVASNPQHRCESQTRTHDEQISLHLICRIPEPGPRRYGGDNAKCCRFARPQSIPFSTHARLLSLMAKTSGYNAGPEHAMGTDWDLRADFACRA